MTSRTHDLAAISALGFIVLLEPLRMVTLSTALLAVLANQIGGIVPDIDQPTAPLWRNLPVGGPIGKIVDKALGGHRFLTHSLLGVGLFGALAAGLLVFLHPLLTHTDIHLVWWAFIIGMVSHLVMDTFTKEGVPWLLPLPFKFGIPPIKELRITTGKRVETLIIFPALVILDVWFCAAHYQELRLLLHHYII
jgi:inner membrane protein